MKALAFGEVLWDIYPDKKCIGGAPLNFAAHFVRCGGKAALCSAVGEDDLAQQTIEAVRAFDVDTAFISHNALPTGRCLVTLDENAVPCYKLLENVAYDRIDKPCAFANTWDVLYFGTLALRSPYNRQSLQKLIETGAFRRIFVDINLRKPFISEEAVAFALKQATLLKVSAEELPEVCALAGLPMCAPEQAAVCLSRAYENLQFVLITLGAQGAIAYDVEKKEYHRCPAEKVKVVSTVGAGDSFSAAFLAKYLQAYSIQDCLAYAAKVSAFVVTHREAIPQV